MKENRPGSRRGDSKNRSRKGPGKPGPKAGKRSGSSERPSSGNLRARLSMGWNPEGLSPNDDENGPNRVKRIVSSRGSRKILSQKGTDPPKGASSEKSEGGRRGRSTETKRKYSTTKFPDDKPSRSTRQASRSSDKPKADARPPRPPRGAARGEKTAAETPSTDAIRLNRYIANAGICSRREADQLISRGDISVNDRVITDLGLKVLPTDRVKYKGKALSAESLVYILLNKPRGYVTTVEDPHADRTVMDLIEGACKERVYPVGRLDKATSGVLLLTNDGELTTRLTHPKFKKKKIYHVFLDAPLKRSDMNQLVEGVDIEGEMIAVDAVSYADAEDKSQVGVELHSGQNRVVRNLFEALGYKVMKLDRVYFAGLTKKNLQRGKHRFLTPQEITMLKRGLHK